MESTGFIEQLQELVANEDVLAVSRDVNDLRSKFDDYVLEEERKFQVAQLEAEEKGEDAPVQEGDFGKQAFYELFDAYKLKRKSAAEEKKAYELKNLGDKRVLIRRLSEVVTSEENIGAAFASFKEIQDKWKEIGDIPRDKRNDIQKEYSKLLEDFFYNINIYKQLKDHDFHRNLQMKFVVIDKLKETQKLDSVKEIEAHLKLLQNEWEDIGPVPNEEWERLKEVYWTEVRSLYNRINRFYEDRREEYRQNIEKKQALVVETEALLENMVDWDNTKSWEAKTKAVLKMQERWKQIGYSPRKESDLVWKEFRAVCDKFFEAKRAFYTKIDAVFDEVAERKKALIDKANELKDSTDWQDTAKKMVQLQSQWKQLGHSGRRNEQKLWKTFRSACDTFFNAREAHYADQNKQFEDNLIAKKALLEKIEEFKLPSNKKQALEELKALSSEFNGIGKVPMKSKDEVYKAFKSSMDKHYSELKMEGEEKERVLFEAKIETLRASPDSGRQLRGLKLDLSKELDKCRREIQQLENNLGFFASTKGAEALKKDVEKKVERMRSRMDSIRRKMRMIPNE